MENLENRVEVRLVNNEKDSLSWISVPGYVAQKIFDKNLVEIHKMENCLNA